MMGPDYSSRNVHKSRRATINRSTEKKGKGYSFCDEAETSLLNIFLAMITRSPLGWGLGPYWYYRKQR
jgi:hypothetical protein